MTISTSAKNLTTLATVVAASLVGFVTGYTIPLISLKLSNDGAGAFLIGIIAALPAAGMMISSFVTPTLVQRFSVRRVLSLCMAGMIVMTFLSTEIHDVRFLAIPRFLLGFACGVIVIIGESWITGAASENKRGALTGLYTTAFTGFQLIGPIFITAGPEYQYLVLFSFAGIAIACSAIIHVVVAGPSTAGPTIVSWRSLFVYLPLLGSGVFCFAFVDASVLAIFPLYGMSYGIPETRAVMLVTVILLGDAIMQVPIGWMADKLGIRRIQCSCALTFIIVSILLPLSFQSPPLTALSCVLLGASAGGLYTLSLVNAGKLMQGQRLITMNAILGLVWSMGSISGPTLSGALANYAGYSCIPLIFAGVGAIFLVSQFLPVKSPKLQE